MYVTKLAIFKKMTEISKKKWPKIRKNNDVTKINMSKIYKQNPDSHLKRHKISLKKIAQKKICHKNSPKMSKNGLTHTKIYVTKIGKISIFSNIFK